LEIHPVAVILVAYAVQAGAENASATVERIMEEMRELLATLQSGKGAPRFQ
jgi:hypothetical protein